MVGEVAHQQLRRDDAAGRWAEGSRRRTADAMGTVAITEDEVDKKVVDRDGTEVGTVADVHHGAAHVRADEATVSEMQARLPQGGIDGNTYAIHDESIADITDDRIVLDVDE